MKESTPEWHKGQTAWKDGIPYVTPGAFAHLINIKMWNALEFGSGGSTIWLGRRCRSVVSFETDPVWVKKVNARLDAEGLHNVILRGYPPEGPLPTGPFDFIMVDSDGVYTDRVKISRQVLPLLISDGVFVLDNYGRYNLSFLPKDQWNILCFDDPHWHGKGTLIATRKGIDRHEDD